MSQENVKRAVTNIINKVSKDPNSGKFKYTVLTHWEGDVLCKAQIRKGHSITIDEPPAFGGCDLGPSPVELVLAALGTCQQIMYSALASTMDVQLDEINVKLTADLDVRGLLGIKGNETIHPGFSGVRYETDIKSSAPAEKLAQLVEAVEKQCPVLDMLTRNVNVSGTATVNGQTLDIKAKVA